MLRMPTICRNPTIEDQALARIHRIGQKQEVTTIRLYVRNSFEEVRFYFYAFCVTNVLTRRRMS